MAGNSGGRGASTGVLIALMVGLFTWYEAAAMAHPQHPSWATVPGLTGPPASAPWTTRPPPGTPIDIVP
jgi:hypothetical protein